MAQQHSDLETLNQQLKEYRDALLAHDNARAKTAHDTIAALNHKMYPRVEPVENEQFTTSVYSGDIETVRRMLQDPGVDPSANGNIAIQKASQMGHLEVVNRLLQDPRVDPSVNNNQALREASKNGHLAVVERLLKDPRVDPYVNNKEAIMFATKVGHLGVLKSLIRDSECFVGYIATEDGKCSEVELVENEL
jgi:hypothetical protein